MHRGAGFVNHASEINRGADFLRQLATRNDPQAMMEFFGDEFSGAGVSVEMRLFAGDFEMSAAEEIALDVFVADDLLDQVDGYKGVGVHPAGQFHSVALGKRCRAQLHPGQDHAAVAGTGSPADAVRFEYRNLSATFCEGARGREAGESGADYRYVRMRGKITRGRLRH